MKYVIINADDFGLSNNINEAVMQSFKVGILKSTSLLINAKRSLEAIELTKNTPELDIGIHLCLVQGRPISKKRDIPTLLDNDGYFFKNHLSFLIKLWGNKIDLAEVEREFNAQITKAIDYNLNITHLDTHQHIHIHPEILKIVVKLAKKFRIPWVRYPVEIPYSVKETLSIFNNLRNLWKLIFINTYKRRIEYILDKNDIMHSNYIMGMYNSGIMTHMKFNRMLSLVENGTTEIIFHPSIKNEGFSDEFPGGFKDFNWEEEFKVLSNLIFKDVAISKHIKFVSFKDLI